jgi:hypothetical protein
MSDIDNAKHQPLQEEFKKGDEIYFQVYVSGEGYVPQYGKILAVCQPFGGRGVRYIVASGLFNMHNRILERDSILGLV